MPNQRAKGKAYVSAYVPEKKLKAFDALWARRGYKTRTEALETIITLAMTNEPAIATLLKVAGKS